MAGMPQIFGKAAGAIERHRGIVLPLVAAGLVFALIVPMPPALMDVLLSANLALAAIILLTAIYVAAPLEFSVFPTVLLVGTLVRLVLNVATTRLVLTAGEGRTPEEAQLAAGHVVAAFSQFVPAGSLAVGVILFAILVIVQFIVVTKGAGRISEVAARFTLDAMPGKQLAIDSDLNAGLVSEEDARQRRTAISHEADFYGAMDGASKFLRGDAVASLLIIAINIFGGLYVGMVQYGWSWSTSVDVFTRLTVGDGLVTQIPAFIMSIAAALLVTRSTGRANLGEQVVGQLGSRPVVLGIAAAFLGALMLTSLPKAPLAMLACGLIGLAVLLTRRRKATAALAAKARPAAAPAPAPQTAEKLLAIDPMRIDLGYGLIRLVDAAAKGDLLERISTLRAKIAEEMGLLIPPVRIRDDMRLDANSYAIFIRGTKIATGKLYPTQLLAVGAADGAEGEVIGRTTVEPVFGLPAVWISPSQQYKAESLNYTIIEPANVLATHLGEVIRSHAADLLTREHLGKLLDNLAATAPHLVSEVTQKLRPQQIQKVLQNLLRERVAIRDLEAILEAISEGAEHVQDPAALTEFVRARLSRTLSQQYCSDDGRLWCVNLQPALEEAVGRYVSHASTLPPELNQKIAGALTEGLWSLQKQGRQPVLLCAPHVRATLSKLLAPVVPQAAVLGYNEVDSVEVQTIASIGTEL